MPVFNKDIQPTNSSRRAFYACFQQRYSADKLFKNHFMPVFNKDILPTNSSRIILCLFSTKIFSRQTLQESFYACFQRRYSADKLFKNHFMPVFNKDIQLTNSSRRAFFEQRYLVHKFFKKNVRPILNKHIQFTKSLGNLFRPVLNKDIQLTNSSRNLFRSVSNKNFFN